MVARRFSFTYLHIDINMEKESFIIQKINKYISTLSGVILHILHK